MIPKIIHYCWLSNDTVPESLKACMDTWKEKLPEYQFILWNFDRFEKSSSKWVSEAFDNKKYAFAADYIRLYALYHFGGIYMDMDIQVIKSFNDLLEQNLMLAYEDEECFGIEAGCFGSEKGNPIIKEILDYYQDRSFIKEDGTFDMLPLPKIMAQTIIRYPNLMIYDRFQFTCKSYTDGKITTKDYTHAIHNFAGSWTNSARKKFDSQRYWLYSHLPQKLAKLICKFPLAICILKESGIKGLIIAINKIKDKNK